MTIRPFATSTLHTSFANEKMKEHNDIARQYAEQHCSDSPPRLFETGIGTSTLTIQVTPVTQDTRIS